MTLSKAEFLKKMKQQFDELNDKWGLERKKYEAMAQHATGEVLKELEKEREEFRKLRKQMKEKIVDLEVASENAWDDVKAKSESAWSVLSESFKKTISRLK
jgi:cell division protein ZapA (FtsZ GTPase activity inhibitor)